MRPEVINLISNPPPPPPPLYGPISYGRQHLPGVQGWGREEEKESIPTPVPLIMREFSWNISEGYGEKALFLKGGRKNWLFLGVNFVSTFNL